MCLSTCYPWGTVLRSGLLLPVAWERLPSPLPSFEVAPPSVVPGRASVRVEPFGGSELGLTRRVFLPPYRPSRPHTLLRCRAPVPGTLPPSLRRGVFAPCVLSAKSVHETRPPELRCYAVPSRRRLGRCTSLWVSSSACSEEPSSLCSCSSDLRVLLKLGGLPSPTCPDVFFPRSSRVVRPAKPSGMLRYHTVRRQVRGLGGRRLPPYAGAGTLLRVEELLASSLLGLPPLGTLSCGRGLFPSRPAGFPGRTN